jgi:SAM-dependent methyltransferase
MLAPFDDRNWRKHVSIQLLRLLEALQLEGKSVCEVGGGDGELLAYLAKRHPSAKFSILDFSPEGCELARSRAKREGVAMNVYQEDLFSPPPELLGHFDLVLSLGVVEHFSDLASVMTAIGRLLSNGGKVFSEIPNFSSPIYAYLCKRWSMSVYEDHVPHDMRSFLAGHERAGLIPLAHNYLGAIEFGMLSMAMAGPEKKTWLDQQAYLYLSRLSKAIHFLEHKTRDFPVTKLFSPFMYVVSVKSP